MRSNPRAEEEKKLAIAEKSQVSHTEARFLKWENNWSMKTKRQHDT